MGILWTFWNAPTRKSICAQHSMRCSEARPFFIRTLVKNTGLHFLQRRHLKHPKTAKVFVCFYSVFTTHNSVLEDLIWPWPTRSHCSPQFCTTPFSKAVAFPGRDMYGMGHVETRTKHVQQWLVLWNLHAFRFPSIASIRLPFWRDPAPFVPQPSMNI